MPTALDYGSLSMVDEIDFKKVVAVYADGGVIGRNPSTVGGTWAFCWVDANGHRVLERSGHVTPAELGMDAAGKSFQSVSNNVTEFLALLLALEPLAGHLQTIAAYTDSGVTLQRFASPHVTKMHGVPTDFVSRLGVMRSCIHPVFTLLGGHPNRSELKAGFRSDGKPVSAHNVWCDKECSVAGAKLVSNTPKETA
jgi:ribonuclease HI